MKLIVIIVPTVVRRKSKWKIPNLSQTEDSIVPETDLGTVYRKTKRGEHRWQEVGNDRPTRRCIINVTRSIFRSFAYRCPAAAVDPESFSSLQTRWLGTKGTGRPQTIRRNDMRDHVPTPCPFSPSDPSPTPPTPNHRFSLSISWPYSRSTCPVFSFGLLIFSFHSFPLAIFFPLCFVTFAHREDEAL